MKKTFFILFTSLSMIFITSCDSSEVANTKNDYETIKINTVNNEIISHILIHYPFNSNEDVTIDYGVSNYISDYNNVTISNKGKFGKSAYFSGDNSFITIPHKAIKSENISILFWYKCESSLPWQRLFSTGNLTSSFYITTKNATTNTLTYKFKSTVGKDFTGFYKDELPLNEWHHIAFTLENGVAKLYVNGNIESITTNILYTMMSYYSTTAYIGKSQYSDDPYFKGYVDEFYVFDKVLNNHQINNLMTYNTIT